jgi:hypothetical protein
LDIDSGSLKKIKIKKVTLTPKQFNSLDHNNRYQQISLLFFVAKFHHMVTRKTHSQIWLSPIVDDHQPTSKN